jgi:hypothetical protein
MPAVGLMQTLANLGDYRQPAVAVAVWGALLAAAAWLLPRARPDGLISRDAVLAILIAVAAVTAIGWEHRPQRGSGSVDLAILGTAWLLALVTLSQPAWAWILGALAVFTLHAVLVIEAVGAGAPSLVQLEAGGYILVTILIAFAALRPALASHTRMSARRASLASRSEAERAAAAAVQADRRSRLARLELEALPLLRGIAEGRLDPADAGVRERCARHAAALRHSLTDRTPDAAGMMAVLQPAVQAAAGRGLLVNVQVIGDPGVPPPDVAHAVLATADAVLGALPPHQVMLTIVAAGEEAELYLTFSEPLRVSVDVTRYGRDLPAAAGWHAAVMVQEAGPGCVEVSWRSAATLRGGGSARGEAGVRGGAG